MEGALQHVRDFFLSRDRIICIFPLATYFKLLFIYNYINADKKNPLYINI